MSVVRYEPTPINDVEKKENNSAWLLNVAKDLKETNLKEELKSFDIKKVRAENIKSVCSKETDEINNMIDALKRALSNLSVAWEICDTITHIS